MTDHYDALRERKVFSALVPAELGGGGASHRDMCAFLRGLAPYCSSTALAVSMHQHLVAAAVYNFRNGKPGQKLLERVAEKERARRVAPLDLEGPVIGDEIPFPHDLALGRDGAEPPVPEHVVRPGPVGHGRALRPRVLEAASPRLEPL